MQRQLHGGFILSAVLLACCEEQGEERQEDHDHLIIGHMNALLSHLYAAAKESPPAASACLHEGLYHSGRSEAIAVLNSRHIGGTFFLYGIRGVFMA